MAEFVVAHILDEVKLGDRFTMWPLHVTILPPFQAEKAEEVVSIVKEITDATPPITAQLGDFAKYGAKRIVQTVFPSPELKELHLKLLQIAKLNGWELPTKYVGDHYTPHITRKSGRDYDGDSFEIESIYIVDALPMGYRKVIAKLPLGGGQGV